MDLDIIRKDTIGCNDKLYLNSAGCSLPPKIVLEKMMEYLQAEELLGGYEVERMRENEIRQFYIELGRLINCQPANIAFAYSASHAYSKALSAIPFEVNDYILTTDDDYISNHIAFISLQKRFGIKIARSVNLSNGDLDLQDFEQQIITLQPKLVAITHIPTNSGLVQQAEAVGNLCKKYDILYLLDACQSVGQIPVDVQQLGCDFLNATGRKFLRGPRSTGFLYVSDRVLNSDLEPLYIDRRGADWIEYDVYRAKATGQRFEEQEISAGIIGLAEAVRYANQVGIPQIEYYNTQLMAILRSNLQQYDRIQLLDKGSTLCNILTFHMYNKQLQEVEQVLRQNKIIYTVSLRDYAIIDYDKKGVEWAIRLSPHYFNTAIEMENTVDILTSI